MLKKTAIILIVQLEAVLLSAQVPLTIEGTVVNNSETGTWEGINIQRNSPAAFIFRNNSVTSVNAFGYMLQAGDEDTGPSNNHLDGEVITGNKFTWNGTDNTSITHGIFTGHNRNALIKYNYLHNVPMGIVRKSANNMTNSSGGVAYNIIIEPNVGIVVKGMSDVNIYNNTFFRDDSFLGRGFIDVYTNNDNTPASVSNGTKIKNNIFYTKNPTANIRVLDAESFSGFECDYNLYWCETGEPRFEVNGEMISYAEWQKLGYDTHSVTINPNFTNLVDFIPSAPLNFGTTLSAEWQTGLASSAVWTVEVSPATANQGIKWQVGARILDSGTPGPVPGAPFISIISPVNQSSFTLPASITITAQASDPDGTVSLVEFFSDDTKIGESSTLPYSIVWFNKRIGTYTITAIATDNSNLKTKSPPVTINAKTAKPSIFIYPNPTSGIFTLEFEFPADSGNYNIFVFTATGKKILEERLSGNEITRQFDISHLASGMYVILIEGKSIHTSRKIIKQ